MSEYEIKAWFGDWQTANKKQRDNLLEGIYRGQTLNRPKEFETFVKNTENKHWRIKK